MRKNFVYAIVTLAVGGAIVIGCKDRNSGLLENTAHAQGTAVANIEQPCALEAVKVAMTTSLRRLVAKQSTVYSSKVRSITPKINDGVSRSYDVELETQAGFPAEDETYAVHMSTNEGQCNVIALMITDEL